MDIQNRQSLMQIPTLHARIGLKTKFEANWTKKGQNMAFSAFGPAGRPGPTQQAILSDLFILCQVLLEE